MRKTTLFLPACLAVFATACGQSSVQSQSDAPANAEEVASLLRQETLCEVEGWQRNVTAAACQPGQKIVFLPSRWGNEQLPILFVAVNCDMRYSIAMTNGGVVCIYAPMKPEEKSTGEAGPEAEETGS